MNKLLLSTLAIAATLVVSASRLDGVVWPAVIAPSQSIVAPGATVTFTITTNQSGSSSTLLNLSNNNSSAFSSFPTSVTIASGQTQVTFQATTSSSYNGTVNVTAAANDHSAQTSLQINREQP